MAKKKAQTAHYVGVRKKDKKAQVIYTRGTNSPYCKNVFAFMVGPFDSKVSAESHANALNNN